MSITLTYNADLSRVQISVDDLPASTFRVERSSNQVFWRTVRGGVSLASQAGQIELSDYEFDPDVENFYRVLDLEESPQPAEIEADSITPQLGSVWLKNIRWPFLNTSVVVTDFTDPQLPERGGAFMVAGRSVPVSVSDVRAGDTFELELVTSTAEAARNMQLTFKASHDFLLHVPVDCPVPGGYVRIGTVQPERRTSRSPRRYWRFPCTVVAPPGPDVTGGTMTYGALLNLYGSYANVLAANGSYADLLALMASPEDLVVL